MQMKDSSEMFLKKIPHSMYAEQSVVGGLLLDNNKLEDIRLIISKDDFYYHSHKLIFSIIENLVDKCDPADLLTVIEELKKTKKLDEAGGESYIYELANNIPSVININTYAKIVYENAIYRKLIDAAQDIAEIAYNPTNRALNDIVEFSENKLLSITQKTATANTIITQKEALQLAVDRIDRLYNSESELVGITTGFKDFDLITKGLQKQDLIVIAARPSMGKTTIAMNIVENVTINQKKPVLIASLEMAEEQLMSRMISSVSGILFDKVFSGNLSESDWIEFSKAVSILSETNISFVVDGNMSPSILKAHARRIIKEHGEIGLIVIDYLQLMSMKGAKENRNLEISAISRELKLLAKELDVPVIVISQLNRNLETRQDKRPILADLRESGAIEQDADLVCFIYRDEVYNSDSESKGLAELIIAKHRNGKIGKIDLVYQGECMRFKDRVFKYPNYL